MNFRLIFSASVRLCGLTAIGLWAGAAYAQTPATSAAPATDPARASPSASASSFRSAFAGYQAYTDDKIGNWKEANDTTGAIGGWRAYAKESQQASPPAAPGADARPDPLAGHAKPQQEKP